MQTVHSAVDKMSHEDLDDLTDFQGSLKDLSVDNYEKLKVSIMKLGFSFAVHAWESPEGKLFILDGHQRIRTMKKMREDGFDIPKIPVVMVKANNFKEAKEKVLAGTSQYGEMTGQGLYEFIGESGLDWRDIVQENRFPEIEFTEFAEEFYGETGIGSGGGSPGDDLNRDVFSLDEIKGDAFKYFREKGFPYPHLELHEQKQELNKLANLDRESLMHSTTGYRIPDSYHKHRFAAAAIKMSSPLESFADDKKLMKAIAWQLQNGNVGTDFFGTLSLVNGTQACSNFRPAFAKYIYDGFCPKDGVVFDSSTGYGGRLTGFLASHCGRYIGTDPNIPTHKANVLMTEHLGRHKNVKLYNSPIEDLDLAEHKESCDLAFTSPPYFVKETYSTDDTQSCQRYKGYDAWIENFLKRMLEQQLLVLKPGAMNIVNIEDVQVSGKKYPLVEPTIVLAQEMGFTFVKVEKFILQSRTFVVDGEKKSEDASESLIFLTRS